MAELKPCPFCGGTKLKVDSKRTFQYGKTKHIVYEILDDIDGAKMDGGSE